MRVETPDNNFVKGIAMGRLAVEKLRDVAVSKTDGLSGMHREVMEVYVQALHDALESIDDLKSELSKINEEKTDG